MEFIESLADSSYDIQRQQWAYNQPFVRVKRDWSHLQPSGYEPDDVIAVEEGSGLPGWRDKKVPMLGQVEKKKKWLIPIGLGVGLVALILLTFKGEK